MSRACFGEVSGEWRRQLVLKYGQTAEQDANPAARRGPSAEQTSLACERMMMRVGGADGGRERARVCVGAGGAGALLARRGAGRGRLSVSTRSAVACLLSAAFGADVGFATARVLSDLCGAGLTKLVLLAPRLVRAATVLDENPEERDAAARRNAVQVCNLMVVTFPWCFRHGTCRHPRCATPGLTH
eukprot:2533505-Rhodomonas_salina.8